MQTAWLFLDLYAKLPPLNTLLLYNRLTKAVTVLCSCGLFSSKFTSSQGVRFFGLAEYCQVQIAKVLKDSSSQDILEAKIIDEF